MTPLVIDDGRRHPLVARVSPQSTTPPKIAGLALIVGTTNHLSVESGNVPSGMRVTMEDMKIKQTVLVFDAADLEAVSAFWATVLGGEVQAGDDWHTVSVNGEERLGFQLAPDHVPPVWPRGDHSQQLHLDLYVDDIATAHDEAMAAGARLLEDRDRTAPGGYVVYADPAGHPFCLCWG